MKAIDFSLPDQTGKIHRLSDYSGKWVVLYFYPRDNTPGCTKEACGFRDWLKELEKLNVKVLGISSDSVSSHKKFYQRYKLNFPILSDEKKEVIKKYAAWGKKKFLGREFEGILRITYLVNPEGEIVKKYEKVSPEDHAREVFGNIQKIINSKSLR